MNVRVLETHIHRTPFGVQCVDSATRQAIRGGDGLLLRLRTKDVESRLLSAFASASGAFGFERVPGLQEWEYSESAAFPAGREFTLLCEDTAGRFLPCSQTLGTINAGKVLPLPLFSTPARLPVPGMNVVRGRILQKNGTTRTPIPFVRIEARYTPTSPVFTGIGDHRGEFALFVPPPDPRTTPSNPAAPLHERTWPLTLTFYYEAAAQKYACLHRDGQKEDRTGLTVSDLEDLRRRGWQCFPDQTGLLTQQTAPVFRTAASGTGAADLEVLVPLGRTAAIAQTRDSADKSVWLSPPP